MMSTAASKKSSDDAVMMICASCGIAEVDDVKLKDCYDGCSLVKYCSNLCQNNHRDQHEEECMKRLAELRDRDLFTQPDGSHLGECPICCLPLSIDVKKSTSMSCCSKSICKGCDYANKKREKEAGLENRCAFCREPLPKTREEVNKYIMKRIKKNCPVAMYKFGWKCYHEGDYKTALEYWTKAAELGDAEAHFNLSVRYCKGEGVEKDTKKEMYHLEEAAVGGHPTASHNLGIIKGRNGRFERARKHFIIAANLGYHDSLEGLRKLYAEGHASKEDYANALRAYQVAVDATQSSERERAEEAWKNGDEHTYYIHPATI
jgi:tetratricopeptide (TPR) repeat protein